MVNKKGRRIDLGKSKRKRNIWFLVVGLLLIAGVVLFAQQFSTTGGFSTLSLDRVDFESNDPLVGGQAFLLTVIQNGAGQYAIGSFSTSELNSELGDEGVETSENLRVDLSTEDQECVYNIRSSGSAIRELVVNEQGDCLTNTCLNRAADRCAAEGGIFANEGGFISRKDFICLSYDYLGTIGTVDLDRLDFESTVTVTVGDEEFEGVISSDSDRSVILGDNRVHASWQGNLVTGVSCPSASGQGVIGFYRDGWSVISESAYDSWKNEDGDLLDCLDLANNNDGFNYDDCVSEHNGLVTVAVRPVDFVAEGGSDVEFTGSANSGELRLPLGRMIEYPMITMRISADVLGIVLPVGVPKIVDVVATDASLGDSGNVAVEIENVGDSLGTFNVAIECPSPFSVRGTSPVVQVASGASVVSNIAFSAGEEASAGCVITVSDIENPFNRDISTVRVSATDFGPPCVDGTIQCIGTVEQVCNAGVWEVTGTGACEGVVIPPVTPDMGKLTFALIVAGITILIIVLMVVFKKRGVF